MFASDVYAWKNIICHITLSEDLQGWARILNVRICGENAEERLPEHGTDNNLVILWLSWVKVLYEDFTELIAIIFPFSCKCRERDVYVVLSSFVVKSCLESILPQALETGAT